MGRDWLAKKLSSQKISTMPVPLKVRGIGASMYESRDFALTTNYIPSIDEKGREVYASISYELYQVNGLKANILVSNDMLYTESFTINLSTSSALIHCCGVKIDINVRQYSKFLKYRAPAGALTIMLPRL